MEDPKQRAIDSLKQATNILVTVKASPSIDALAACIALTLVLNELGKHGTAVFSGEIPSVLDFLEPSKTLERNTDSLQDFIISLDKSKADKLRYKVEDSVVKIFITPYKTSISEKDLDFGQGDFNVDVVVALGVHNQNDLDQAITVHGRILHDATVISMDTEAGGGEDLGSINWIDANASSLSEMVAGFVNELGKDDAIDNQVATALLTGIVAETERFGNAKTTPDTMKVAAALLTAGANQELVATKLSEPAKAESAPEPETTEEKSDTSADQGGDDASGDGLLPSPLASGDTPDADKPADADAEPKPDDEPHDGSNNDDNDHKEGEDGGVAPVADEPPKPTPGTLEIEHSGGTDGEPLLAGDNGADIAHDPAPADDGHGTSESEPAGGLISAMPQPATEPDAKPKDDEADKAEETDDAGEPDAEQKPAKESLLGHHTVIQPLHSDAAASEEPPKLDLDPNKFALTPPSMGGTLTASSEPDQPGVPGAAISHDHPQILKHDAISQTPPPSPFDAQAAEAEPAVAPLPPVPTAMAEASPPEPPESTPSLAEPPQALMAAPLLDGGAPMIPPAPEAPVSAEADDGSQTLADIERSVNSAHTDGVTLSSPDAPGVLPADDPVLKPADMPLGSLIPGLPATPAPAAPTPVSTTPPPPVPPPLPQ